VRTDEVEQVRHLVQVGWQLVDVGRSREQARDLALAQGGLYHETKVVLSWTDHGPGGLNYLVFARSPRKAG
jgi:hypothetical protein